MFVGREKLGYLANIKWLLNDHFLILSDGRFITKMSFGPTLFSENYPDDPVA